MVRHDGPKIWNGGIDDFNLYFTKAHGSSTYTMLGLLLTSMQSMLPMTSVSPAEYTYDKNNAIQHNATSAMLFCKAIEKILLSKQVTELYQSDIYLSKEII